MEYALNNSGFKQKAAILSRKIILDKAIWTENMSAVEEKYLELIKDS